MKRISLVITTILLTSLMLMLMWVRTDASATRRQQIAVEWTTDYAALAATGLRGEVLHVALPDAGQAECDAFLDELMTNRETVSQLKAAGFEKVKCGSVTREMK